MNSSKTKVQAPPIEIYRRRGIVLPPIITKCFDETMSSRNPPAITLIHVTILSGACQGENYLEERTCYPKCSKWSSKDTGISYSGRDFDHQESCKDELERYRHFFNHPPVMKSFDPDEKEQLGDMSFQGVLKEGQQPCLPFEKCSSQSREDVASRAFWDNIRKQLQFDDDSFED